MNKDFLRTIIVIVVLFCSQLAFASKTTYVPASGGEVVTKEDYSKRIIFKPEDFTQPGHLLQVVTVPPRTNMRVHWHNKQTEVYYIIEGEGLIILDGKKYEAKVNDAFIVRPGVKHKVWNKSGKLFKQVVFKIDYPAGDDTVWTNKK